MRETHKGIYCSGKAKSEEIEHSNQDLDERKKDLEAKKSELEEIVSETKQEEEKLREKAKYWKQLSNRVCCRRLNVSVKFSKWIGNCVCSA